MKTLIELKPWTFCDGQFALHPLQCWNSIDQILQQHSAGTSTRFVSNVVACFDHVEKAIVLVFYFQLHIYRPHILFLDMINYTMPSPDPR